MGRSKSSTDVLKDLAKNPKVRSGVALAAAATAGAVAGRRKSSPANDAPAGAATAPAAVPVPEVQGYCMKERKKVQIANPVQTSMKNGKPAITGACPDCGTKIFRIGTLPG